MNLDYANIPTAAKATVESLAIWCAEQLATRNTGKMVKERSATVADDGLEFAASVSKYQNPEGDYIAVCRFTLRLPDDYALSKSWAVVEEISQGSIAATGFYS